jgi:hypothetical protein
MSILPIRHSAFPVPIRRIRRHVDEPMSALMQCPPCEQPWTVRVHNGDWPIARMKNRYRAAKSDNSARSVINGRHRIAPIVLASERTAMVAPTLINF